MNSLQLDARHICTFQATNLYIALRVCRHNRNLLYKLLMWRSFSDTLWREVKQSQGPQRSDHWSVISVYLLKVTVQAHDIFLFFHIIYWSQCSQSCVSVALKCPGPLPLRSSQVPLLWELEVDDWFCRVASSLKTEFMCRQTSYKIRNNYDKVENDCVCLSFLVTLYKGL